MGKGGYTVLAGCSGTNPAQAVVQQGSADANGNTFQELSSPALDNDGNLAFRFPGAGHP